MVIDAAINQVSARMREKNINLRIEIPEELPLLQADREGLQQIIGQLLQNASLVTPVDGTVSLRAGMKKEDAADYLILQVTDEGGGIAAEDLPSVSNRRYRADNVLIQGHRRHRRGIIHCAVDRPGSWRPHLGGEHARLLEHVQRSPPRTSFPCQGNSRTMNFFRQLAAGFVMALASSAIVLGALSLASAEGIPQFTFTPSVTATPGLPQPGQMTDTPQPTPTPIPPTDCPPPPGWVSYVVQAGDTLDFLALLHGFPTEQISVFNCLRSDSCRLQAAFTFRPCPPPPTHQPRW